MVPIDKTAWVTGCVLALVLAGGAFYALREPVSDHRRWTPGDRCAVHDVAFETDVVPIESGMLMIVPGRYEARKAGFPNDNLFVGGGCVGGDVGKAWVKFCPACRAACAAWSPPPAKTPAPYPPRWALTKAPAPIFR